MKIQKLLKIKDVASILSVSSRHVQRMVYEGRLPAIHLGPQTVRIPEQALEEWFGQKTDEAVNTQKRRRRPI
jgi:excisionase family DNA binding protein